MKFYCYIYKILVNYLTRMLPESTNRLVSTNYRNCYTHKFVVFTCQKILIPT
uniref:Uncharacterized protein n=1 Tax=Arundo donax TaxID=35708 RepID=A0A0A9BBY9_ARUDO